MYMVPIIINIEWHEFLIPLSTLQTQYVTPTVVRRESRASFPASFGLPDGRLHSFQINDAELWWSRSYLLQPERLALGTHPGKDSLVTA